MPGLGTSFGRGGATTAQQDLVNADAILIMGSSMAENHPVGFQWVVEARERGAHLDRGAVYRFNVNHVVEPDDPLEMFPMELFAIDSGTQRKLS